jgi:hypothetical protein
VNAKHLVGTLLLALATPSHALFDPGNVGLPTTNPGIFDPTEPPLPPVPPPPPPPISIRSVGFDWIEFEVRPPAGRTSALSRLAPGSAGYEPFRSLSAGVETAIRDQGLGVGKGYCYRIEISGGGLPDESHTRCAETDWRVGFEGLLLTQAESSEVLRLFDWRDTQRLAEGTADEPALYHMNLLIDDGDPLAEQGFRYMGMHVQSTPIFHEELQGWNGAQAVAKQCDGPVAPDLEPVATARSLSPSIRPITSQCQLAGRWAFAVVPGRVYNELRDRMLEQIGRGEAPGVRALVFRRVPVAAALAQNVSRHVLDYVYLGEQGLEFNAIQQCRVLDGVRVCEVRQELLGWIGRKVAHWVVEVGDAVVEGVRSAIGRVRRLVKGDLRLDLQIVLLNTDPAFGAGEVLRSGWSGEEIKLSGVKVEVRQGLAAFYAHTDAQGFVTLKVARDSDTDVCIQVENDTAEITEYLIETTVCVRDLGTLSGDYRRERLEVAHPYLNALAVMTDARRYLARVAGFSMPKISVMVGGVADSLAVAGRSFTPCTGRRPSLIGVILDGISLLHPAALAFSTFLEFNMSVDMVLAGSDPGARGVAVHEYGHAAMCELIAAQGFGTFLLAWGEVMLGTLTSQEFCESCVFAEAFADFFTAQVVGGTNYFSTDDVVSSANVHYCLAGSRCLEENFTGFGSFGVDVAHVASILHDAFDGHAGPGPNDASHWTRAATGDPLTFLGAADSDRADEVVALFGTDLETLFSHWDDRGTYLNDENFMGAVADLAKARGYSDTDVCAFFVIHSQSFPRTCPDYALRSGWLGWIDLAVSPVLAAFAEAPERAAGGRAHPPLGVRGCDRGPEPDAAADARARQRARAGRGDVRRLHAARRLRGRAEAPGFRPRQDRARHRLRLPPRRGGLPGHRSAGPALRGGVRRARRPRHQGAAAPGGRGGGDAGPDARRLGRGARRRRRLAPARGPAEDRAPARPGRGARRQDHDPLRGRGRRSRAARQLRRQAARRGGLSARGSRQRAGSRARRARARGRRGALRWHAGRVCPVVSVIEPFDGKPASVGNGVMVALAAGSRAQVDALHRKALELGGQDEGAPGPRGDGFYAGYLRDLDGNKLNAFVMG